MTKETAIQIWLKNHPEPKQTPDSIARMVCYWYRVRVNKYDVIAVRGR